jgi:hypothetical protein
MQHCSREMIPNNLSRGMVNKNSSLTATLKDHRNFYIIALVTIGLSRDLTLLPLLLLPFVRNYKKIGVLKVGFFGKQKKLLFSAVKSR